MNALSDTRGVPLITLNDGEKIPQLGFGVWQVERDKAAKTVALALETGYRHIDTAKIYENEEGVGQGIRDSGIPRDNIFLTSKLWNDDQGYDSTMAACDASLERLGLDYLDLYLIHWPCASRHLFVETWKAFIELRQLGKVRSIGVSNFTVANLDVLIAETDVIPTINQIELHPMFSQHELRRYNQSRGIITEDWSPLARASVLENPAITAIADAHGRTPAQIVLRWQIELGCVVIPKTTHKERMQENFAIFDFSLTSEEITAITALDAPGSRQGPDPDEFQ